MNQSPFHGELEAASRAAINSPGREFTARWIPVSPEMVPRPTHQVGRTSGVHVLIEDDDPVDGQPMIKISFCKGKCRGCP